jgi:glutathione synthase/RimK-type ligase-like ATP-grasp enzyme
VAVLLVGNPEGHEGRIARQLTNRGTDWAILDARDLARHPVTLHLKGTEASGELETTHGPLDIRSFRCVWMGAPLPVILSPKMDLVSEVLAIEEWSAFYESLFALTADRPWVNPRDTAHHAESKLLQAQEASRLGIATPETLVTSDPSQVAPFLRAHGNELAMKLLNHRSVTMRLSNVNWEIFTNRITPSDARLEKLEQIRITPVYLQEYVRKRSEARAWVVGDRVFSAEIFSQEDPATLVDWRRYPTKETPEGRKFDTDRWHFGPLDLDPEFQRKLVALARRLGLVYTAIDLVRREDGEWVFLEANDGGAYQWVEEKIGLPISEEIARLLTRLHESAIDGG